MIKKLARNISSGLFLMKKVLKNKKVWKAGKGAARACRREGRIPAVIYGGKQEPIMISLHPVELEKALNMAGFYNADIEIVLDGKTILAVCQDVQFHPVSDMPLHVDFVRK